MAVVDHTPGFSQVTDSGWTGNVTVTIGAVSATITPSNDSAASVWIALVNKCELLHGGSWEGWSTSASKLVIAHSSSFTITATGTTQTRLGLAASTTGTEVAGTSAHFRGTYPIGLSFEGYNKIKEDGVAAADGSGATPLIWKTGGASIQVFDTWQNNYDTQGTIMAAGDIFTGDIWMGGRSFGRYFFDSVRLSKKGKMVDHTVLNIQCSGIEE